ncbi:MAG: alpha-2-macroglobulin family protein, partial [Acidobacteriota bacterium]
SRQARGGGFYDWTSTLKRKTVWTKEITTGAKPVDVHIPLKKGGLYILTATAGDAVGRSTTTNTEFYVLGPGYTAWARSDNNIIDLVPEHKSYKPGDTARIMIKSPWEKATALYTVEREGIRQYHEFALTSTQQTIEVPITQKDIPNVYVSVLLVKGRTSDVIAKDGSDPGKPTFRMGYCELKVDNAAKRLHVDISTDKEEYRPADNATVTVKVKDANGKPAHAEVTLWAVDYGVLSLTGYKTPDVLGDVYAEKALQVMNEDSRQRLISRRVITPKGAETGGGGGVDNGPGVPVRKDFRVLAFWIGSAATDNNGTYTTTVKLPEGLTSYRIMAVVNDKENRFGKGQKEIRVSKKVLLTSAFPRFLTVGDKAYFGAVLTSRLKQAGTAQVAVKSLDPGILKVTGEAKKQVDMKPGESSEVRFQFKAGAVGKARIQMSVRLLNESDAFQKSIPVELLIPPEVVAAYGIAHPETTEKVALPGGVLPKVGGLSFELSSTAMVGLGEGARYLVSYPYGCAEQRASCALALMLAADLGDAFKLPGVPAGKLKEITQQTLDDLQNFQCDSGGFVYWKGSACLAASPYLTSYVLHVMQEGVKLGYKVPGAELDNGYRFLMGALNSAPPNDASTLPAYLGWQAFAVKVLAAGGRTVDSQINRLYSLRDSMPVYGLCWLWDAMKTSGIHDGRTADLKTRIDNTILPEAGTAHVEELNDPYLLWYWSSNVRSTAIALGSIVRDSDDSSLVPQMVRWLMKVRKKGRWGNTQENAWAMESLVDYYRKYEKEVPDFTAVVRLGMKQLMAARFKGRSTQVKTKGLPMQKLLKMGNTGAVLPLDFKIWGTGKLFYVTRLKYASTESKKPPMDHGFSLTRSYAVMTGDKAGPSTTTVKAGDVVEVTLTFFLTKGRRFVAVTDPLPAGLEPVESWFQTTSSRLSRMQDNGGSDNQNWRDWFMRGGWDHVERHDDRVQLFATWLSEGKHVFKYLCRATTAGTFRAGSAHVEEMYEPEVWGRSSSVEFTVQKK